MRRHNTCSDLRISALALLAVWTLGSACSDQKASDSSMPSRRPMTTEEFYEVVVGRLSLEGVSGSYAGFSDDPPTVSGFDGCNSWSGSFEFADGSVDFPDEGMQATELACPGVATDGFNWVFGQWLVEPDGSVVVIAESDGQKHEVPGVAVPRAST